jgi:uncharacterized membrane protein
LDFHLTLFSILVIVTAALAIYDGIMRVRGTRSSTIVAVVELVFAVLLLLTQFIGAIDAYHTIISLILEVALVIIVFIRGRGRWAWGVTLAALILNAIVLLTYLGWLNIPGL